MSEEIFKVNENEVNSDCREEEGIAIGLIDGIITNLRCLKANYSDVIDKKDVKEALLDLSDDEDFTWLKKITDKNE